MTFEDEAMRELRRLQEDMLYTEKAHFAAASRARTTHYGLGGTASLASAGAAASVVADGAPGLSAVLALVGTLAAVLMTFLKPDEMAQQHLAAGRDLGAIRVEARQAMNLDVSEVARTDIRTILRDIAESKAATDRAAPALGNRVFEQGRKKIAVGHFDHDSTNR